MIPYTELEKAIARWKVRQAGGHVEVSSPFHEVSAEAVVESEAFVEAPATEVVLEGSGLIAIHEETTKH